jgi:hypothetical protein
MINQQDSPETATGNFAGALPETRRKMQNFIEASKLAGNTQNMPTIPKNRRKTLKTEQKQPLEARRSLTGVSPEIAGTRRRRQNRPATSKTATTEPNDDHISPF